LKLGKTSWLIITIGIFSILLAGLCVVHAQQVNQLGQLNDELAVAQLKLSGFQTEQPAQQPTELEKQLSETKAQSETARTTLSQSVESITISNTLFETAESYGVEVIEIKSSGMAENELAGVPCSTLSLNARIKGEVANLVNFITRLNNELATGVVRSIEINIPESTSANTSTANFQLVVYTYRGD
jgi:hypothetical protein